MTELYEALCDMFIRPTRQHYSPYDLGCPLIGSVGRRRDLTITNTRGFKLQCSYYEPIAQPATQCVIYLHSLNGCRLQCIRLPEHFLKEGIAFASLDFTACGNSQGQYVSLGCHETQDTLEFVEYLHHNYKITGFALWGRSMGAVTAIKFADVYQNDFAASRTVKWSLVAIVLDSPFSNLHRLALEIADKKINIPSFLIKAALLFVRRSIEQKADFKFEELDLTTCIHKLNTPVMILASKEDQLISYRHSEEIFHGYAGKDKQLEYVQGNHNEYRGQELVAKLSAFVIRRFEIANRKQRDQSIDDGRRRMNSKSSSGNLPLLISNKSYTMLNASSLTPTSKPSARVTFSNQKQYNFRTSKKRQPHTQGKPKIHIGEFSEKVIGETDSPLQDNDHIQIQERAHYNIIHEKLGNMKKKGFLMASPLEKKVSTEQEIKRKHTISLSKSPLTTTPKKEQYPHSQIPGYHSNGQSQKTSDIKNSIIVGNSNLLRFNKKPDYGSLSNRKEDPQCKSGSSHSKQLIQQINSQQYLQMGHVTPQTPTK